MSKQLLSAAVDAAATEAEWDALIDSLDQQPGIKSDWSRIWACRDAHDGVLLKADGNFCSGVMAAIAQEKPLPSNVVSLQRKAEPLPVGKLATGRSWRTLVPLSAAAGVVAAVLFVGGLPESGSENTAVVTASPAQPLVTMPVSFSPGEASVARPDAAKAAILNAYLMEHSNSLAERSMGGTLANARFAARTADYRPDAP